MSGNAKIFYPTQRSTKNPFRAMQAGEIPPAPASQLLGLKILELDETLGTCTIEFEGKPEFVNPIGTIQGGFVAAMLDDTFSIALLAALGPEMIAPTVEMKISFIRAAKPGRLIGKGRVVHKGGTIGFAESELFDAEGRLIARASATAALRKLG